jgi:hypothetical protein
MSASNVQAGEALSTATGASLDTAVTKKKIHVFIGSEKMKG